MSLDKRSTAILMQLINANSYVSINELTERINVSRRTVYYDVEKINDWLESQDLDKIRKVRSAGFILTDETKVQIPEKISEMQAWHYEYSVTERKAWIAIYILASDKAMNLENLMEIVRVSRNTTIEDIKSLKENCKKFDLELEYTRRAGYVFHGKEVDIRKAIVYYLSLVFLEQNWQSLLTNIQMHINSLAESKGDIQLFQINTLKTIYRLILDSEKELNIQFTDDVLHSMSLRMVLFSKRVKQGCNVKVDTLEKEVLRGSRVFGTARRICHKLERVFDVTFPGDEQYYLTTHLLGAKVNYSSDDLFDHELSGQLRQVAEQIVNDFQRYACVLFQNKDLLVENLLLHLHPTYYRIKYGIKVENQLVEAVRKKYKEIYQITKRVLQPFEQQVGKTIHENEIIYIAMHFGGWMHKKGTTPTTRKQALVVCANGVGTTQILKQQLEGLFSEIDIIETLSVREYEEGDYHVDLVISTIPLVKKDYPVVVVNPILTDTEKEGLLKKVNQLFHQPRTQALSIEGLMDLIQRHADIREKGKLYDELKLYVNRPEVTFNEQYKPDLTEILPVSNIQISDSVSDWKEAISLAAKPLLNRGAITDRYVKKMIENVEEFGPYIVIAPKFAIPHAKPEHGVQQIGMSLLRLNEDVAFSKERKHDVQFILVLAAIDNEAHLKALSQLTHLFSTKRYVDRLQEATSRQAIIDIMDDSISQK